LPTRLLKAGLQAICSAAVFLFILCLFFNNFCQTNYLKIYQSDLHKICGVGRNMAVDDQSDISCQRMLPGQPTVVGFIHRNAYYMYVCGVVHRTDFLDRGG